MISRWQLSSWPAFCFVSGSHTELFSILTKLCIFVRRTHSRGGLPISEVWALPIRRSLCFCFISGVRLECRNSCSACLLSLPARSSAGFFTRGWRTTLAALLPGSALFSSAFFRPWLSFRRSYGITRCCWSSAPGPCISLTKPCPGIPYGECPSPCYAFISHCSHIIPQFCSRFGWERSEEHTSELQSQSNLVCRLLLE